MIIICRVYRIRFNAAPGFYFSIWVFGWESIQKIPQKVDFFSKKWGFIQENPPQKLDFSHYLGLYSGVGLQYRGYGISRNLAVLILYSGFVYYRFHLGFPFGNKRSCIIDIDHAFAHGWLKYTFLTQTLSTTMLLAIEMHFKPTTFYLKNSIMYDIFLQCG